MANTFTSRDTLKTKLLAAVGSATTADQIVKLSRSIEKANLDDDADLETALDTKVAAMAASASTVDIEKLAFGVKKLRTPPSAATPTSSMVAEGSSNLYVTDSRVRSSFSASGDLSYNAGTGVLSYTALPDALTVYATVADLPASGVAAGAKGIVEENKKLYIFTGASWVGVGLVDQKPNFTTTPDGSYALTPGADTVITLAATDPQGDAITYSYQVTAGALGGTTVSQADNVFTISASSNSADAGSFSLSFTASDGTNLTTTTPSEFTLAFGMDWSSVDFGVTAHTLGVHEPSYDYFGQSLASDDNVIGVSAPRYQNPGNLDYAKGAIRFYTHDFTYAGEIVNTTDSRDSYGGTAFPSGTSHWQWAGHQWLSVHNGRAAFVSKQLGGGVTKVVDVWDLNFDGTNINPTFVNMYSRDDFNSDGKNSNSWGMSGDLRGNYLILGDSGWDSNKGKVFVFDVTLGTIADPTPSLLYTIDWTQAGAMIGAGNPNFGKAIAIADNGTFAVSAPFDVQNMPNAQHWGGSVMIFNISDGSLVTTVDVSHYGLAGLGNDHTTYRSPARDGKELAISEDGSRIIVGDNAMDYTGHGKNGVVSVWEVSTGNRLYIHKAFERVSETNSRFGQRVDISSDGTHIVWSAYDNGNNDDGTIWIADIDNNTLYERGPTQSSSGLSGVSAFGTHVHFTKNKLLASTETGDKVWYYG